MIFEEFEKLDDYNNANKKCHESLIKVDGYNSPMYASEKPIVSTKGTYLLPIIEKFKKDLPFQGKEVKRSYIKVVELHY